MTDAATKDLIQTMLDSGKLSDETTEDFQDFLKDLESGELHKDDVAYIHTLAERLEIGDGNAKPKAAPRAAASAGKSDGIDWQERAVIAEARIQELEGEIAALKSGEPAPVEEIPSVDTEALNALIDKLYDAKEDELRDVSSDDAAETLKQMLKELNI